jgi:hypothetical protein
VTTGARGPTSPGPADHGRSGGARSGHYRCGGRHGRRSGVATATATAPAPAASAATRRLASAWRPRNDAIGKPTPAASSKRSPTATDGAWGPEVDVADSGREVNQWVTVGGR